MTTNEIIGVVLAYIVVMGVLIRLIIGRYWKHYYGHKKEKNNHVLKDTL